MYIYMFVYKQSPYFKAEERIEIKLKLNVYLMIVYMCKLQTHA